MHRLTNVESNFTYMIHKNLNFKNNINLFQNCGLFHSSGRGAAAS